MENLTVSKQTVPPVEECNTHSESPLHHNTLVKHNLLIDNSELMHFSLAHEATPQYSELSDILEEFV